MRTMMMMMTTTTMRISWEIFHAPMAAVRCFQGPGNVLASALSDFIE